MSSLRTLGWTTATVFALTVGLSLFPNDGSAQPNEAVKGSKTKVFRLQHCDPNEATPLLESLLESIPRDPLVQPAPAPAQGNLGFGGGGMIGVPISPPTFSTAQDARTRAIIVRGNDKHLQLAADFVAVIDVPKGKAPPVVKTLRAVQLKNAEPLSLEQTIEGLSYNAKIISMPAAKMIVFTGSEEVMNEIGALIKELDVETPPAPKPEDIKPLVADPKEAN